VAIRLVVGVGLDDFDCNQKELPHLREHLLFSGIDETGEAAWKSACKRWAEWNAYTSSADTTFVIEARRATSARCSTCCWRCSATPYRRQGPGHRQAHHRARRRRPLRHLQRWLDRQDIGHPASDQLAPSWA
jgi:hypothetical protein